MIVISDMMDHLVVTKIASFSITLCGYFRAV